MDTLQIVDYLKQNLSEYRFRHTIGVAQTAKELAEIYGEDKERAYLAGLLHDIAKEMPIEEMLKTADKYSAKLDELTKTSTALMHGVIGAYMAEDLFGIDEKIFDAIKYHTTGKADMSLLTKIIYIADYVEPNRSFSGVEKVRAEAYSNIDKAIFNSCNATIIHTVNKNGVVHTDTVEARNYLLLHNRSAIENEEIHI